MKRNIRVEELIQIPIERQYVEIVERKGVGHPDSICDGIAEAVSQSLCKEYSKEFDTVLHHNTDQVELVAGRSNPLYGGGQILKPIYILLSGRASNGIDINSISINSAKQYLKDNIPDINIKNVDIESKIGMGSTDLQNVFQRGKVPMSNDTSFGVGHAPFSELDQIVYKTERFIISDLKPFYPSIGTDIKVMGVRNWNKITLTIACAMIDKYLRDETEYFVMKEIIRDEILDYAKLITDREVKVFVNIGDDEETGSVYLTVSGTSAETGDDGSVGRGNRCNGLITPNRPMSMEATSGKNPINHVGKIYNLLSNEIANEIITEVQGIEEIYIRILSQIGKPIDQPLIASAQIIPKEGYNLKLLKSESENIIDNWLSNITKITEMVTKGQLKTF